jgi:hypothetical protein
MSDAYFERLGQAPPGVRLQHLISGYWISQAMAVAVELRIADLLADGAKGSSELAAMTNTDAPSLYRLLRTLASVGLYSEIEPGRFGLTDMGALLREDHPTSLRPLALALYADEFWQTYRHLRFSVETGQTAFAHVYGMDVWDYRAQHPEVNARFNAFQASRTTDLVEAVVAGYDFSSFRTVVDVGGGHGVWLAAILGTNPGVRGVLFDLPHVAEGATLRLKSAGLLDRCEVIGGNMLVDVPPEGDAYMLSRVIHDWDDVHARTTLANCRRAMGSQGKLLLIEEIVPPGDTPGYVKLSDLTMLVMNGGQERTEAEYRALCEAAGLAVTGIVPTRSRMSIIEAMPYDGV